MCKDLYARLRDYITHRDTVDILIAFVIWGLISLVGVGGALIWSHEKSHLIVYGGLIVMLSGYQYLAYKMFKHLRMKRHEPPLAIVLYLLISFFYITFFALFYVFYDAVRASGSTCNCSINDVVDAYYFSVATFTTLGFGDYVPYTEVGKIIVLSEALLGSAHTVFFVLVFLKNGNIEDPKSPAAV